MGCRIGLILYFILQCVAFAFILIGTPIDMFRSKGADMIGNTACLTMWGSKTKCYSTTYNDRPATLFSTCSGRLNRFRAAEAFAIINIGVYGAACILGFVQLCCCHCLRWACLLLNIVGMTSVVSWAIMADAANSATGRISFMYCAKLSTAYKYGAGFALLVVAWCLDIINIVFLMLPC